MHKLAASIAASCALALLACGDEPLPRDPPPDVDFREMDAALLERRTAPTQVSASATPTRLLDEFFGPMSIEAAFELLDPSLARKATLDKSVEPRGACPGYRQQQFRVDRWEYAEHAGALVLEFLNGRLVYVAFVPDRYESFHAALAADGLNVRIDGTPSFRDTATRITSLLVDKGSGFSFSDDRMARELRETIDVCRSEYPRSGRRGRRTG